MPSPRIESSQAFEDTAITHMARIEGNDAANLTQASLANIQLKVIDDDNNIIITRQLTVVDVIFDTLQTTALDARWTKDSTGYNFKYTTQVTDLPAGNKVYRFEYRFKPINDGPQLYFVREVQTIDVSTTSG